MKNLKEKSEEFFCKKGNENVHKVYFTSDGNMFCAEHYAQSWGAGLTDKTVTPVARTLPIAPEDSPAADQDDQVSGHHQDADPKGDELAELTRRFIELFDTKPESTDIEAIKADIAAKEAELVKEAELNQQKADAKKAKEAELKQKEAAAKKEKAAELKKQKAAEEASKK